MFFFCAKKKLIKITLVWYLSLNIFSSAQLFFIYALSPKNKVDRDCAKIKYTDKMEANYSEINGFEKWVVKMSMQCFNNNSKMNYK